MSGYAPKKAEAHSTKTPPCVLITYKKLCPAMAKHL